MMISDVDARVSYKYIVLADWFTCW